MVDHCKEQEQSFILDRRHRPSALAFVTWLGVDLSLILMIKDYICFLELGQLNSPDRI